MQLAERIVNDYDETDSELVTAVASFPEMLMKSIVAYIGSLSEVTETQCRNLITFLERQDLPLLVRADGVRMASDTGKLHGRLTSTKLCYQLLPALPLLEARHATRKTALRDLRFIDRVEDLPEYLTHTDPEITKAAKERFEYLQSFPERRVALQREIELREKRERLVEQAQRMEDLARYCNKDAKEHIKERAEELLVASKLNDKDLMTFEE